MSERIVTRKGDVAKRKAAQSALLAIGQVRQTFNQRKHKSDLLFDAWEAEKAKTGRAQDALEVAETNLAEAQEVIDADYLPEGAQPPARIHKRDQKAMVVAQLQAALEAQRRGQSKAFDACNAQERLVMEVAQELHKYVDTLEDADVVVEINRDLDQVRAKALRKLEYSRANSWETEQRGAIDARVEQINDLTALAEKQVEATRLAHKGATKRVKAAGIKRDKTIKGVLDQEKVHQDDRQEAVLELKTNTDIARNLAAKQSDKKVQKALKIARQLENEKEGMISRGMNPYVEFRQREFDAEAKATEKRMKDAVVENKVRLGNRLINEEVEGFRDDAADAKARFYEKQHRDAQGRHVKEEKTTAYIKEVMSGGHEVLDPTGRAPRVDPSQVTNIPDKSFGLGKSSRIPASSMRRITENVRKNLQVDADDLGEYQRLITGLMTKEEKEAVASDRPVTASGLTVEEKKAIAIENERKAKEAALMSELKELGPVSGKMPGTSNAAMTVNLEDDTDERDELLKIAEEQAGGAVAGESLIALSPKYKLGQQTQFELNSLEAAKAAQRARLEQGTVQIAGGREFKGQAFVPKPAQLQFVDFVVGEEYTKIFTLTNASYTFNSFKILALDDTIVDFFEITFEKPGRMSAGVSCPLTIKFKPEVNEDIRSYVRFQTQTGPVEVPLICLIKRCAPRIIAPVIEFGNMIVGQINQKKVDFNNTQAIGTGFTVSYVDENNEPMNTASVRPTTEGNQSPRAEEVEETIDHSVPAESDRELLQRVKRVSSRVLRAKQAAYPQPISLKTYQHSIDGYGTTNIDIVCAPLIIESISQRFCVEYDKVQDSHMSVDDTGALVKRKQYFDVTVVGEDLPIYLADETLDMRTCLVGRVYRQRIQLLNRSRVAYKVNIDIKAPFSKYVEASPNMCFVQGKGSQFINIKYTPTDEMLQDLGYYTVPQNGFPGSIFAELPIQIDVTNQDMPVFFNIRSHVTSSTVALSSNRMEFGTVYVNQFSTNKLTLTNTSLLPQKIAFVRLKKEITVQPNDGFAVLLPGETLDFQVSFCPSLPIPYNFDVTIITSNNDTYNIKIVGNGVESPIDMSNSVITMRTTGPGERVVESCTFTNTTSEQQIMEITAPDARFTWLKISPTILDLAPGASQRVECEYCPPRDTPTLDPEEWHNSLKAELAAKAEDASATDAAMPGDESTPVYVSPFDTVTEESGWVWLRGMYGEMQWTKAGAGTKSGIKPAEETEAGDATAPTEGSEAAPEEKGEVEGNEQPETDAENKEEEKKPDELEKFVPDDLPANEWGVGARWSIPICILDKSKKSQSGSNSLSPMFISVNTMVTLPQIVADVTGLDFGQLSLGTRVLKSFKIINKGHNSVSLDCNGINAVGCFTIIRPPKTIAPGEVRQVMIECLLSRPGMNVDMLEITNDKEAGGHALRLELRAHGLKPLISLDGVLPPPSNWNSRCGILDFADVVANDRVVKKFNVLNSSSFAVDVSVLRTSGKGLSPANQAQLIERTTCGLPVISFRPEQFKVGPGESMDIEVTFSSDTDRFRPYREDLEIVVGQTDEVLKVGIVGRSRSRQVFVRPGNPADEPFNIIMAPGGAGVYPSHDSFAKSGSKEVRDHDAATKLALAIGNVPEPPLKLEYPNPFADDALPDSYTIVAGAPAGKAAKGAPPPTDGTESRSQVRRLIVSCAAIADGRAGSGNGTFEIKMSPAMAESGYFTLSTDKGAVNAGADTTVDITCTLPQPRGMGGLSAGSWKDYTATIVLSGGWFKEGEVGTSEVPVVLQAFVGL
jgi:hypothetical protein